MKTIFYWLSVLVFVIGSFYEFNVSKIFLICMLFSICISILQFISSMGVQNCKMVKNATIQQQIQTERDIVQFGADLMQIQLPQQTPISLSQNNKFLLKPLVASRNILALKEITNSNKQKQISPQSNQNCILNLDSFLNQNLIMPALENIRKNKKKHNFQLVEIDPQKFVHLKRQNIYQHYEFLQKIGSGSFGVVLKARSLFEQNDIRAIKKISKKTMNNQDKLSLLSEVDILKRLDHPNIIKLYDLFEDDEYYYFVTQLCQGGNLLNFINNFKIDQTVIRKIMVQLLSAVNYMHNYNILHKDLKLENLVIVKPVNKKNIHQIDIKIIDFGISINLNKPYDKQDLSGTIIYMPPQSLKDSFGLQWDIWSCGIIMYMISTKKIPYEYHTDKELQIKIMRGHISKKHIHNLERYQRSFLLSLLEKNPKIRLTAQKTLKHAWIRKQKKTLLTKSKKAKVMEGMIQYDANNSLVSMIESYLVFKKISQNERQHLAQIFQEIDEDKSGIIQIQELKKFYATNSVNYNEEQMSTLLKQIDKNKSGKIDFNQFLTVMHNRQHLFEIKSLNQAFMYFDSNNSGYLDKKQIKIILEGIENEEIQFLFSELDKNNDQLISKDQFILYLVNKQ